jgi:predicted ArsR family transcriptional regulator
MGAKLAFLSWLTPKFIISRELDTISTVTNQALQETLRAHVPDFQVKATVYDEQSFRNLHEKRAAMTRQHNVLVEALVAALGEDTAVKVGREALFKVGVQLGTRSRNRLGVGDSEEDLVRAAQIMYRVLAIDFDVEWIGPNQAVVTVNHCALAENYSEVTCQVLSATDEGVVNGLNPNMSMKFEKRITSGCKVCTAKIQRRNQA